MARSDKYWYRLGGMRYFIALNWKAWPLSYALIASSLLAYKYTIDPIPSISGILFQLFLISLSVVLFLSFQSKVEPSKTTFTPTQLKLSKIFKIIGLAVGFVILAYIAYTDYKVLKDFI